MVVSLLLHADWFPPVHQGETLKIKISRKSFLQILSPDTKPQRGTSFTNLLFLMDSRVSPSPDLCFFVPQLLQQLAYVCV